MMDKGVKQRLLGGVVLVVGAVLFLPYVFEGAGNGQPLRPEIPARPVVAAADDMAPQLDKQEAALNKAVDDAHSDQNFYPVAPAASAQASASAPAQPSAPVPAPAPAVVAVPVPEPGPTPADKLKQEKARATEKAAADKALAERVAQEKAATEQAAADKLAADKAAAKAEKARLAAESKKAAASGGLPEAWVVQVASLSSADKAGELVAKLHKKGYHAASRASGDAWKVTVGPELSKDVAESLRQKLAADPALKLSGWVQSYHP
jgi:cell division septation protein DedD